MTRVQHKWLVFASPMILLTLVVGAISAALCSRLADADSDSAPPIDNTPLPVTVTVLGRTAPPAVTDTYRGLVIASKTSELAFRRTGRVAGFAVQEGAKVSSGQLLASLESEEIQARIAMAQANIAEAEAYLAELQAGPRQQTIDAAAADVRRLQAAARLANATAMRQRKLVEANASSDQEYDDARSMLDQQTAALTAAEHRLHELREGTRPEQLAAQRARVQSLQAQLRSLEVDLRDCQLTAPYSGVISRRYLDEGAVVGPETRALKILQIEPLEARFGVTPADAARHPVGTDVLLTIDDVPLPGRIARIEPEVDLATRTQGLFVTILPAPHGNGLVPGRTISLALTADNPTPGLWVPMTALARADRGLWSLFVAAPSHNGSYVIERREIQIVDMHAELAKVSGASVNAGDLIVGSALHRVTPGMQVQPIQP